MAQIGRIGGPLLEENLLRNGIDLAFRDTLSTTQLLYIDVTNRRIGVNLNNPSYELETFGTTRSGNLIADSADFPYYTISDNDITAKIGNVYLNAPEAIVLSNLETTDFKISDNTIETIDPNTDINLSPNGTGDVNITNSLRVFGDIYTPGTITLGGSITFGDGATDSVDFNADVSTDIVPDQSGVYNLGSNSKRWQTLYTTLLNGNVVTDEASIGGTAINLRQGGIFYVAENGDDANVGDHPQGPFATIRRALDAADASGGGPITVFVFPGTYQEQLPLVVPPNVSVIGEDIRNTIIVPDSSSTSQDVFYLNGETTVQHLTIKDFQYDSVNNTGYAFRFAPNAVISTRSPYVQNVTVKTQEASGSTTPADIYVDPEGLGLSYTSNTVTVTKSGHSEALVQSWIGKLLVTYFGDGYPVTFYTVTGYADEPQDPTQLWQIQLAEPFEFVQQGYLFSIYPNDVETIIIGSESVAVSYDFSVSFNKSSLPPMFNTTVGSGWTMQIGEGVKIVDYVAEDPLDSTKWRVYLTSTSSYTFGPPIFASPTVGNVIPAGKGAWIDGAEMNSASINASMLFHSCTFITPDVDAITMTNGVRVEWLNSFTYFANRGLYAVNGVTGRVGPDGSTIVRGAEVRSIGSANVYGNYGAVADGSDTLMYLIKHNFAYIGSGLDSSNDRTLAIQENEVVELNSGRIYYQSTDHLGNFRVGDNFFINLDSGKTSIDISDLGADSLTGLIITSGTDQTFITGEKIETGNIRFNDNTLSSLAGDLNLVSASTVLNFQDNTNISGNLDIRDNFSFSGTLNISGDQTTDRLEFNVELEQDFNPNQHLKFTLGSQQKPWLGTYLSRLEAGEFSFYDNRIETNVSNANLELRANGSGIILIPSNNVSITNNLTVNSQSNLDDLTVDGTLEINGNINQQGSFSVTGDSLINGDLSVGARAEFESIEIDDNFISTLDSNANLDLYAASGGKILVPNNDVKIDNNLTVNNIFAGGGTPTGLTYSNVGTPNIAQVYWQSLFNQLRISVNPGIEAFNVLSAISSALTNGSNVIFITVSGTVYKLKFSSATVVFLGSGPTSGTEIGLIAVNPIWEPSSPGDNTVINITSFILAQDILSNATVNLQTLFDTADVSDILITENNISSTATNTDLELRASGTGKVILNENVDITNDLDNFGTTTFKNSTFAQGFGPQLVVNGTFNTNISGWTSTGGGTTFRDPAGYIVVEAVTGARITSQNISVVPGALYQFSADIISATTFPGSPDYSLRVFESGVGDRLSWNLASITALGGAPRTLTGSFVASTNTVTIALRSANASVRWDNFSLIRDLGIIETITPIDVTVNGTITHVGNTTQTGNITATGDLTIDGSVAISEQTDFSNYTIDENVLSNRRFGLSLKRTDTNNPLGFYNIVIAMGNGATADDYPNQTEKNLINFLANGTTVATDYAYSYADANQNGFTTLGDAVFWLQYIANGTTNDPVIDAFLKNVTDQLITIEFNNPGTFNKDVLLFGDYFEPDVSLQANGTGKVIFGSETRITNDLTVNEANINNNIVVTNDLAFEILEASENTTISDNFITTSVSNSNLELRSTRDILIPSDNTIFEQSLDVNGITNLKNNNINGTLTVAGNKNATGDYSITGNLTVRNFETTSQFNFPSISTAGNVIKSNNSNENLELRANGAGIISIPINNVTIVNDLTTGTINSKNINIIGDVIFDSIQASSEISIFDNVITTTNSNSNLELRTVNSRSIVLESLRFNGSTLSTTSSSVNFNANTTIDIDSTGAVRIPSGTTVQRSTVTGTVRFNTTDNVFEGFSNNRAISFNGVYSDNRRTSVLADPTNNTLNFTVNQLAVGNIAAQGLTIHGLTVDDISLDTSTIRTTNTNSDLELRTDGTGELVIDSISIIGNTVKNNFNGPLIFENQNYGVVKFATDKAVAIPYGTNAQRPVNPEIGTTRWNTEETVLEVWDGSTFVTAAGQSETITAAEFQDLMLEYTLIFG